MSVIEYFPPIGESGYVYEVDWDKPHFYYNSLYGDTCSFDEEEARGFLALFGKCGGHFVERKF